MTQADMTPPTVPEYFTPPQSTGPVPPGKLYNAGGVGIATFLGTPLAGSIVMAINYRRLGRAADAVKAVAIGAVATLALVGLGFAIDLGVARTAVGIGVLIATINLAKRLQGPAVDAHTRAGGQLASNWAAAGIGLLLLVVVGGAIFGIALAAAMPHGTRLAIGSKDEIYYSGSATQPEAQALGDALKKDGFLQDHGASVFLGKAGGTTTLSFVVNEGVWDDAKMRAGFETIAHDVAPAIGGLPITLRLMNAASDVKKEWVVR